MRKRTKKTQDRMDDELENLVRDIALIYCLRGECVLGNIDREFMFGKPCAEEIPSLYIIRCSRKLAQEINPIGPWALRDTVQNILLGSYVWGDPISSMGP